MPRIEPTHGSPSSNDATSEPSSPPIPLTSTRCPCIRGTLSWSPLPSSGSSSRPIPPVEGSRDAASIRTNQRRCAAHRVDTWPLAVRRSLMFAIGIVPAAAIAKAVGPAQPACPGATYSVVSGDSWSRIASRSKVSMTSLMNANGATTATVIHPGQTLCLPGTAAARRRPRLPSRQAPTPACNSVPARRPTVTLDVFPVQGPCSFGDTYGAPRSGGRFARGSRHHRQGRSVRLRGQGRHADQEVHRRSRLALGKWMASDDRRRHVLLLRTPQRVRAWVGGRVDR